LNHSMIDLWGFSESTVRSVVFLGGFTMFSLVGLIIPYRVQDEHRLNINLNNFGLILTNALMQKVLGPLTLISLAFVLEQKNLGIFNLINLHFHLEILITIVLLDLSIYFQHLLTHRIPVLWKLHRVHHTDTGFDTSTALRFHPLETLFSLMYKAFFIFLIGASPLTVFIFEALINFSAMFHHSNFKLPPRIEKTVSRFIVTPDIHRIHHSVDVRETDSNFAFFISAWDPIFGTKTEQSKLPPETMPIGLETHREIKDQSFWRLLLQPFK